MTTLPLTHRRLHTVEIVNEHQVPWSSPGRGSHLVPQHQHHNQESPAASLLPAKAEEGTSPTSHPHHLLQRNHREHPKQLHHCLVWELHRIGSQVPAAGVQLSPLTHPYTETHSLRYLYTVQSKSSPDRGYGFSAVTLLDDDQMDSYNSISTDTDGTRTPKQDWLRKMKESEWKDGTDKLKSDHTNEDLRTRGVSQEVRIHVRERSVQASRFSSTRQVGERQVKGLVEYGVSVRGWEWYVKTAEGSREEAGRSDVPRTSLTKRVMMMGVKQWDGMSLRQERRLSA
ncbi:hypothetical protein NFI96_009863, partial [Prochilodus magdalenae]